MNVRTFLVTPISLAILIIAWGGCAPTHPSGSVSIDSRTANPLRLQASFGYGGYAVEAGDTSLILSTVALEKLQSGSFQEAQIIHVQLMWMPKAGSTPVNNAATNVVIRYIVLVDKEAGVYGGGGFAWPQGTPGDSGLGLDVTGSSLSLLESTDGFRDLLSPAELRGWIGGPLAPETMTMFRNTVSQIVTDRLGKAMWIKDLDQTLPLAKDFARESSTRAASLAGSGQHPG